MALYQLLRQWAFRQPTAQKNASGSDLFGPFISNLGAGPFSAWPLAPSSVVDLVSGKPALFVPVELDYRMSSRSLGICGAGGSSGASSTLAGGDASSLAEESKRKAGLQKTENESKKAVRLAFKMVGDSTYELERFGLCIQLLFVVSCPLLHLLLWLFLKSLLVLKKGG